MVQQWISFTALTTTLCNPSNTLSIIKKAHQNMHFLRKLKRVGMTSSILRSFYRSGPESTQTSCIIVRYCSCTVTEEQVPKLLVK